MAEHHPARGDRAKGSGRGPGSLELPAPSPTQWVAFSYLGAARIAMVGALLSLVWLTTNLGEVGHAVEAAGGSLAQTRFMLVGSAYLLIACLFWLVQRLLRRWFYLQLVLQTVTDLVAIGLLAKLAASMFSGISVLMIAAVAGASVLAPPMLAGVFASLATFLLLADAGLAVLAQGSAAQADLVQAGLIGAACFVTAYLVNLLAVRLDRQERVARQRGEDLRNQQAINQRVIAQLHHGVLVISRDGVLRQMNDSAAALLGVSPRIGVSLFQPGLARPLVRIGQLLNVWRQRGASRDAEMEADLPAPESGQARFRVRLRLLPIASEGGDMVMVIEDLRTIDERAQQLKLAAMGRLSASIAHEIRNPLSAIRHANSLIAEQLVDGPLSRLARIVETNTVRIDRIIGDVLSISRREPPAYEAIEVQRFLPGFVSEFTAAAGEAAERRIQVNLLCDDRLWFDPNHLRQVLNNLLGNAMRYASDARGAVRIEWRRGTGDRLELTVADDGPGLAPEALQHAFEPFFTTEAQGTGLGLYLTRELCHINGAVIRYESRGGQSSHRGEFVIEPRTDMPRPVALIDDDALPAIDEMTADMAGAMFDGSAGGIEGLDAAMPPERVESRP